MEPHDSIIFATFVVLIPVELIMGPSANGTPPVLKKTCAACFLVEGIPMAMVWGAIYWVGKYRFLPG